MILSASPQRSNGVCLCKILVMEKLSIKSAEQAVDLGRIETATGGKTGLKILPIINTL